MRASTSLSPRGLAFWVPLLLLLMLAVLPTVAEWMDQGFFITLVARMLVYALAAVALNLALGYGGLVSFGHALFFGVGSYCVAIPAFYGIDAAWLHLLACIVVCALLGAVTGMISLRTSGIAFIMITLAFAQMGYFVFVSLKNYGGDDGMTITALSRLGPLDLGDLKTLYYCAFVLLCLALLAMWRIRTAPFGMVLRGARQNLRRVHALGFAAQRYQLAAYVISAVLCGVAGVLFANLNAFASPSSLAWSVSGDLIVMVVLGGMGSVTGPLLGALAFLGMEEFLKSWTDHWAVVFGPMIVLIALTGRAGIAGVLARLDQLRSRAVPAEAQHRPAVPARGLQEESQ
ncbi:branched-chain amino acid ABC transporter permease [Herbaspirillum rubrisubalbicans]|uniref:branched-chain amino acid ABC transporter permease n=1 Tax=Herbaspirillum rubrisubalbicans TaxID=80842 RepID=UPI0015C54EC7|nr:branched-chain amino acid ABC transporter permease [Herbaspirillum rubrisubalbicans]NQE48941.1 ABC transporter permease [Herbaspirillum rubrisubalbicans]